MTSSKWEDGLISSSGRHHVFDRVDNVMFPVHTAPEKDSAQGSTADGRQNSHRPISAPVDKSDLNSQQNQTICLQTSDSNPVPFHDYPEVSANPATLRTDSLPFSNDEEADRNEPQIHDSSPGTLATNPQAFDFIVLPGVAFSGEAHSAPIIGAVRKKKVKTASKLIYPRSKRHYATHRTRSSSKRHSKGRAELIRYIESNPSELSLIQSQHPSKAARLRSKSSSVSPQDPGKSLSWHAGARRRRKGVKSDINSADFSLVQLPSGKGTKQFRKISSPTTSKRKTFKQHSRNRKSRSPRAAPAHSPKRSREARDPSLVNREDNLCHFCATSPSKTSGKSAGHKISQLSEGTSQQDTSEDALKSFVVTYDMEEVGPLQGTHPSKFTQCLRGRPLEHEYDPLYDIAFEFARNNGYGFVHFVEDKTDEMRRVKRSPSRRKKITHSQTKEDRINPVHIVKTAPKSFGRCRMKCTTFAPDGFFDYIPFLESVKEDIAKVRQVNSDLEDISKKSPDLKRTSPTDLKGRKPRKHRYRRRSQRVSPSTRSPDDETAEETPEDEDIILSAPLDKYMEYLSQRCGRVCQEASIEMKTSKSDEKPMTKHKLTGVGDPMEAPDTPLRPSAQTQAKSHCSSDSFLSDTAGAYSEQHKQLERLGRHSKVNAKCGGASCDSLGINLSGNNAPDVQESASTTSGNEAQDGGILLSESSSRLPRLTDKTSLMYKLCNSLSATIFRETQLAQRNVSESDMSRNLPVTKIDVVHMQDEQPTQNNIDDSVLQDGQSAKKKRHRKVPRKIKPLQNAQMPRTIARIHCSHKGVEYCQSQFPRLNERGTTGKYESDKVGSCPNLAIHSVGHWNTISVPSFQRPKSKCKTTVPSDVADSPKKIELVSYPSTAIRSPAWGDGKVPDGEEQDGILGDSMAVSPVYLSSKPQDSGLEESFAVTHKSPWLDLKYELASTSNSRDNEMTGMVNNNGGVGRAASAGDVKQKTDTYQSEKPDVFDECTYFQKQRASTETTASQNCNNNALPQMTPACDKTKPKTSVHRDRNCSPKKSDKRSPHQIKGNQQEDQPLLRLPVLPVSQNPPGTNGRSLANLTTLGHDSSVISIPSVTHASKTNNPSRSQTKSGTSSGKTEYKNESNKLPSLLNTTESLSTVGDKRSNGGVTERHCKRRPSRLSPVPPRSQHPPSPSSVDISNNQTPYQGTKFDDLNGRCLNKSYTIHKAEVSENHDACKTMGPGPSTFIPDSTEKHHQCDQNLDISSVAFPAEESLMEKNTKNQRLCPGSTMSIIDTSSVACLALRTFDFIPKPIPSTRSPEFATLRKDKEEKRVSIGRKSIKDSTNGSSESNHDSLNKNNNTNNSSDEGAHNSENPHINSTPLCCSPASVNLSKTLSSCSALPMEVQQSRAVMSRKKAQSIYTNQHSESRNNSNNKYYRHVATTAKHPRPTVSGSDVGLDLEEELLLLTEERTQRESRLDSLSSHLYDVRQVESQSDINASHPPTWRCVRLNGRDESGRSMGWSRARQEQLARRRCLHTGATSLHDLVSEESSSDSSDMQQEVECLNNQPTGIQFPQTNRQPQSPLHAISRNGTVTDNRISFQMPSYDEYRNSQDSFHPNGYPHRLNLGNPQVEQTGPFCPTTENYWQTATQEPHLNPFPLQTQQEEMCSQINNGTTSTPNWMHCNLETSSRPLGFHNSRAVTDDPMNNNLGTLDSQTVRLHNNIQQNDEANIVGLYKHLDTLWEQSQKSVSQQLEAISKSVEENFKSLQEIVEKRFNRTCSLIQSNKKCSNNANAKKSGQEEAETVRKNADVIHLNTRQGEARGPSYGFPLNLSEYMRDRKGPVTSKPRGSKKQASESMAVVKQGSKLSSGASVKTFPTMQFHEVTQQSDETLDYQPPSQTTVSNSSGDKQELDEAKKKKCPERKQRSVKKGKMKNTASRRRYKRSLSPTYKSMRLWKEEANNPLMHCSGCKGKNGNSRYCRHKHSRSCRRRRGAEGVTCCNRCLPNVPVDLNERGKVKLTCTGACTATESRRKHSILRNSKNGRRRTNRRSRRNRVRFKLKKQVGRRRRRKKLRSPPLKLQKLLRIAHRQTRQNNNCLVEAYQKAMTQQSSAHLKRLSPRAVKKKLKNFSRKQKRVQRNSRETFYVIAPLGHKTLYDNLRKRYERLERLLTSVGYVHCDRCLAFPRNRKERLVDSFRSLIHRFPEKRLKALQKILRPVDVPPAKDGRAVLGLAKRSPAKPRPVSTREPNRSTNAPTLRIQRPTVDRNIPGQNCNHVPYHLGNTDQPFEPNRTSDTNLQGLCFKLNSAEEHRHYLDQMFCRPGFYFFNTTTSSLLNDAEHTSSHGSVSNESTENHEPCPRPVDSLNVIRKQLSKSRNKSKNACYVRNPGEADSHLSECANGDGRKVSFIDQNNSLRSCGLPWLCERLSQRLTTTHRSERSQASDSYHLNLFSLPSVMIIDAESVSSLDMNGEFGNSDENINASHRDLHGVGSTSVSFTEPFSCNLPHQGSEDDRHHRDDKDRCIQWLKHQAKCDNSSSSLADVSGSGIRREPSERLGEKHNFRSFQTTTDNHGSNKDQNDTDGHGNDSYSWIAPPVHSQRRRTFSHHTGMFDYNRVLTDQDESSVLRKDSENSTQQICDVLDFGSRAERNVDERFAVEGSSQSLQRSEVQKSKDDSRDRLENSVPGEKCSVGPADKTANGQAAFRNSLWAGFANSSQNTQKNYKTSHLFSFETMAYRSPLRQDSGTTTASNKARPEPGMETSNLPVAREILEEVTACAGNLDSGTADTAGAALPGEESKHSDTQKNPSSDSSELSLSNGLLKNAFPWRKDNTATGYSNVQNGTEETRTLYSTEETDSCNSGAHKVHSIPCAVPDKVSPLPTLVLRLHPNNSNKSSSRDGWKDTIDLTQLEQVKVGLSTETDLTCPQNEESDTISTSAQPELTAKTASTTLHWNCTTRLTQSNSQSRYLTSPEETTRLLAPEVAANDLSNLPGSFAGHSKTERDRDTMMLSECNTNVSTVNESRVSERASSGKRPRSICRELCQTEKIVSDSGTHNFNKDDTCVNAHHRTNVSGQAEADVVTENESKSSVPTQFGATGTKIIGTEQDSKRSADAEQPIWTFQQPYLIVNPPGIATTWFCIAPTFSPPLVCSSYNTYPNQMRENEEEDTHKNREHTSLALEAVTASQHSYHSIPSSSSSKEHNNNAIRSKDFFFKTPPGLVSHAPEAMQTSPSTACRTNCSQVFKTPEAKLSSPITHSKTRLGHKNTRSSSSKWHASLIQHLKSVTVCGSQSARKQTSIFNTPRSANLKPNYRKRRAGSRLLENMAPPRKIPRLDSHFSLSQFLSTRRERIAMRRARWQFNRELRYLKSRKEYLEWLRLQRGTPGCESLTAGEVGEKNLFHHQGLSEENNASDADSESSL